MTKKNQLETTKAEQNEAKVIFHKLKAEGKITNVIVMAREAMKQARENLKNQ